MATRLSLDDFNAPDWGPLVLSGDWPGFRAFWSAVLQLATADQADAVVYRPDLGDDCLAVEPGGQTHMMDPPPVEYRRELLAAARKMALGDPEGNVVGRLGLWHTAVPFGRVLLDTPLGVITWEVTDLEAGAGVRFSRARQAE